MLCPVRLGLIGAITRSVWIYSAIELIGLVVPYAMVMGYRFEGWCGR